MNVAFPAPREAADLQAILDRSRTGVRPTQDEAHHLAACDDLDALMRTAATIRDAGFGDLITHSRKVFIPLTRLCRDVCHYCTFATAPSHIERPFLSREEVLAIARAGRAAGCREALFTLGDKPEMRYRAAREALTALGHETTIDLLAEMARFVFEETGLLPHLNPGTLSAAEIERLRPVSVSMGMMLETASERLTRRGGPHFGSPDKHPTARLATIEAAGRARVPFTSGLLIGIGETRLERIEALLALRLSNDRWGHIQEVIIQNFRAKPMTHMAASPEPTVEDHLWTIAVARIVLGPSISVQAPPNLAGDDLGRVIAAGIDDWGGVSPVTIDHVNPEAPWPHLERLARETADTGKSLVERLAIHPRHIADLDDWVDPALRASVLRAVDAHGLGRTDAWSPGVAMALPEAAPRNGRLRRHATTARVGLERAIGRAQDGQALAEAEIVALFAARDDDYHRVCAAADEVRRSTSGDTVGYVVTRNINYTNVCAYRCRFCAFSKGKTSDELRGRPYDLDLDEIAARAREAWSRGATEVCIQGGIHPSYTGRRYLEIVEAVKSAVPEIHIHAFSPLEIRQGAATLGLDVKTFLRQLRDAGLASLPGTAAEILDDEIRRIICSDKVTTSEWLDVVRTAHEVGLPTTSTIMYGHIERPVHWARHLIRIRTLQVQTGGFTEFVPLPFVPMEAPMYLKGKSRTGPTLREAVLMHAVARLALHPSIPNIQASWVKLGQAGVRLCLEAGANDFGGTLMDESISRSAGAAHGQDLAPARMEETIRALGRVPRQRTTLYQDAPEARQLTARQVYEAPEAWRIPRG